ncbi:RNHCP domain-containing protein [Planctomycetales bacterium ZRK34]|nr:RNHCP domain-containing protein [Planctomycetales bacterium ZRK34]
MKYHTQNRRTDRRNQRGPATFTCRHCRRTIDAAALGTGHRNHCPYCLWSRHVDETPGDRASTCGGLMEPIAIWVKHDGEWSIVHRCGTCGHLKPNRIAGDDSDWALMALAARALSNPPIPID